MKRIIIFTTSYISFSLSLNAQGSIDIDDNIRMGVVNKEHVTITNSAFSLQDDVEQTPLIYGDFGTGNVGIGKIPVVGLDILGQDVNFYSGTTTNSFRIGRDAGNTFEQHVTDYHGYFDYIQDGDQGQDQTFILEIEAHL